MFNQLSLAFINVCNHVSTEVWLPTLIVLLVDILGITVLVFSSLLMNKISFKVFCGFFIKFWFFCLILVSFFLFLENFYQDFNGVANEVKNSYKYITIIQRWFDDNSILLNLGAFTYYFVFTISIISLFANFHTLRYMCLDQKKERFALFLNGFALSMLTLVLTKNVFIVFLCWEMLGVTSFFLIKHNETQQVSVRSAFKALAYNKISDVFLILSLVVYVKLTNTLNIDPSVLVSLKQESGFIVYGLQVMTIYTLLIFIFIAASLKSVQIFSYMWLPDSMKAPAPASALIHSATLVAAGFYLIFLFKDVYFYYFGTCFMTGIGICTAVLGAFIAVYQEDLKKILAFSTISNCGFMLALLSMYDVHIFLVYFTVHGIFKSVCFMFSGDIITAQHHNQDLRTHSNLFVPSSINTVGVIISLALLSGFPVTVIYSIKHSFILKTSSQFSWVCFDILFQTYSYLSILYAFVFLFKVFFMFLKNKEVGDAQLSMDVKYNSIVNASYAIACCTIGIVFYGFTIYNIKTNYTELSFITSTVLFIQTSLVSTVLLLFILHFTFIVYNRDLWSYDFFCILNTLLNIWKLQLLLLSTWFVADLIKILLNLFK